MYNGQFVKGFIHVGIFAALVAMAEEFHAFGIFIFAFIVYMVVDAYQTAKAMEVGAPLPDLLGINRLAANVAGTSATAVPPAGVAPVSGATGAPPISQGAPVAAEPAGSNAPLGAIILILIGALFLLDNMGIFHMRWVGRMWPLILIVIGLWMLFRRRGYPQQG
jgi:hypothetical protein